MISAGRRAFRRKRRELDDLYDYFESDLTAFLSEIYRAMRAAEA